MDGRTPEPPPPGSTAEAFDILRRAADALRHPGPLTLEDFERLGTQTEGAVDHIDALTDKLEADLDEADQDVTRLNNELQSRRHTLAAIREWVGWATSAAEMGYTLRLPREVAAETNLLAEVPYCAACRTSHPSAPCPPPTQKGDPTRE